MTTYIEPIFDRTQDDVDNKTSKGFFNVVDWQRINNNTQLVRILAEIFYNSTISQNSLTTPSLTTIPTVAELNSFLENINLIIRSSSLPTISGLVEVKDDWVSGRMAGAPDYIIVNSWEQILDLLLEKLIAFARYEIYCGVAASGQPRFWQHRFREYPFIPDSLAPVRLARTGISTANASLTRNNRFRRYT